MRIKDLQLFSINVQIKLKNHLYQLARHTDGREMCTWELDRF